MKRFTALLLLMGCQSATQDPQPESQADLVLAAQLTFDIEQVQQGQWARYTIREEGKAHPQVVKYAAVGGDESGVWVENKVPGDPRPFIIKSKYSWKGDLLERWVGEAGSPKPAKIYPPQAAKKEPLKKEEEPKVETKIEEEPLTVAGRSFECAKITTTLTYANGRVSTLVNWCSDKIPFSVLSEGKPRGGLVKRVFGKFTLELANFGNDALPELDLPKE